MATARQLNAKYAKVVPSGSATVRIEIDTERIYQELVQRAVGFLNSQADTAYRVTQQLVPVRKVFYGGRRANRLQPSFQHTVAGRSHRHTADFRQVKITELSTGEEIVSLRSGRAMTELNYKGHLELRRASRATINGKPNTDLTVAEKAELRDQYEASRLAPAGSDLRRRLEPKLSIGTGARGKNMSAVFRGRLGGRLKGEIDVIYASNRGTLIAAFVISPTPYARYVEFGTRHNRAQPYMRPAIYHIRNEFREGMKRALKGIRR